MARPKSKANAPTNAAVSTVTVVSRQRVNATILYPTKDEYLRIYNACGGMVEDRFGRRHHVPLYDGRDGWGQSTEQGIIDTITQEHRTGLLSPLHIGDFNPDGSVKKPHWHYEDISESLKNFQTQIKPFFDLLGGVGRENVGSMRGYARYLCHLDNPEKCEYNPKLVKCFGGADYQTAISLPGDTMKGFNEIVDFIERNDIYNYADLICQLKSFSLELETIAAMKMTYPITKYLKARLYGRQDDYIKKVRQAKSHNFTGKAGATGTTAGKENEDHESED